jgi:hypothetical protein
MLKIGWVLIYVHHARIMYWCITWTTDADRGAGKWCVYAIERLKAKIALVQSPMRLNPGQTCVALAGA